MILLKEFAREGSWLQLDLENPGEAQEVHGNQPVGEAISGFYQWRQMGLVRRKRTFFAVYIVANKLVLRIDNDDYNFFDIRITIRRMAVAPFIKRIRVVAEPVVKYDRLYWGTDLGQDPFGMRDIRYYIEQCALEKISKFVHLQMLSEGKKLVGNIDEIRRRVNDFVS